MLHFARWKSFAIIGSVLLAMVLALPNILPPAWNQQLARFSVTSGLRPMTLGLDLQGGSNVLLEVDRNDLRDKLSQQLVGDIRAALREAKIGYSGINRSGNGVTVRVSNPADVERARVELKKLEQPVESSLFGSGRDFNTFDLAQQDQQFTLAFSEGGLDSKIGLAISQAIKIVESRINGIGVAEAVVQQQGKDRIVVQLPGVQDPDRVKGVIGRTAKLTFQLVCESQPTAQGQVPPPDCKSLPTKDSKLPPQMWVQTSSRATVDGADLTDAKGAFDQNNQPVVSFRFNSKGAERFGRLTRENVDKPFAIVLDDLIVSAPRINEPILGGQGQISGNFTVQETTDLAIVLRSGALPAKLTIVEERTVGPSLGSDSIRAGFNAAVIGLVLVMVFMVVAYGLFGLFANVALLINLIMLVAIMSVVGFTLTLPGIAGIVLTMGIAVDSNVIIFERMREEWRNGRTAISSIETGFRSAFATIFDSNFTAFIAAVVLFGVGSGPVRGFAVTHAIGIMTTVYTAYTVTRFIVAYWARHTRPKEVPL
ncbi:MAG: protein translocase subunit SecD [Rhizobiales bacterium]|nr:protein translocase subunit SecD [Hyphomicrobiales bacterium]MBI3673214.1 protein translocase subunit SecD [Hyphomicrobiales bacterium]